jgi:hypothetical protein
MAAKTAQKIYLPGFLASVACRLRGEPFKGIITGLKRRKGITDASDNIIMSSV